MTASRLGAGVALASLFFSLGSLAEEARNAPTVQEIIDRTQPSVLLGAELNRTAIVDGLVSRWGDELEASGSGFTKGKLGAALKRLRTDHLLAVSMAKTSGGVLDVLTTSLIGPPGTEAVRAEEKAIGSTTQDLVFTPVAPCRLVDTRNVGGPWAPFIERVYAGFTFTTFAFQGGAASNCGVPGGVAALAIEAIALYPPADGWFYLWPANIPHPQTSTFNYGPALSVITFGTILPVHGADQNRFKANSSQPAHLIIDVVGYFAAPQGGIGTAQIADGAVTNAKLAAGSLPAAVFSTTSVQSETVAAGGNTGLASPPCSAGTQAISGNCSNSAFGLLVDSYRSGNQWICYYRNIDGASITVSVSANCMTVPAVAK